jgi:hypothetical protein
LEASLTSLGFVTEDGYNYDRPRVEGEGRDWENFAVVAEDRDDWED